MYTDNLQELSYLLRLVASLSLSGSFVPRVSGRSKMRTAVARDVTAKVTGGR